ncbi:MAG: hypothetical protein GXO87_01165 [Chlorobi bacterium]|nr:hypothetical protein [Chlorobiota bacterium]
MKGENYFSPRNRLRFGEALFSEGDYLRASDEFAAYLNRRPNDAILFKIGYANLKLGNYFKAENVFQTLSGKKDISLQAKLMFVKTKYLSGDEQFVASGNYKTLNIPEPDLIKIEKLKLLTILKNRKALPDSAEFFKPFQSQLYQDVSRFYFRKKNMKEKSPITAAALSAVIPGAGKIYTENYGDGATAFLVTGLLAFLAYDNFQAEHNGRAWIFTGLAAFFYAGNVYGSYLSAKTYNLEMRLSFENDVKFFIKQNDYFIPEPDFLKR